MKAAYRISGRPLIHIAAIDTILKKIVANETFFANPIAFLSRYAIMPVVV